ncbi:MAG: LysM peptidoglycan-binding domain-containing protein [Chlamydiae bacterium]|nr:LysM peptidoglycan-binding domain-containing protein [Chlamydiota bacterium]
MFKYSICVLCLTLTSCSSHLAMLQRDKYDTSIAIDEMRMELSDVKHTLSNTQVEMQILEEKVRTQDVSLQKNKNQSSAVSLPEQKLAVIEKKISQIEKMQDKLSSELKQLGTHANHTTSSLTQYQVRITELESELSSQTKMLQELSELKGTLRSITHAIKGQTTSPSTYKVKAGDSLEKISRIHNTSVESLKKANNLSSTKIVIGQDIRIPSGDI